MSLKEMKHTFKGLLLDLDGTLLDINNHKVFPECFSDFARLFGTDVPPDKILKYMLGGIVAMTENKSGKLELNVFSDYFCSKMGITFDEELSRFRELYLSVYHNQQKYSKPIPEAIEVIRHAKQQGMKVVCSTNPVFLKEAIDARLAWAGLKETDFDLVTNAGNSHACKPYLTYFEEIFQKMDLDPSECLVVGDEPEDMIAAKLGCKTFLVHSQMTIERPSMPTPTFTGNLRDLIELIDTGEIKGDKTKELKGMEQKGRNSVVVGTTQSEINLKPFNDKLEAATETLVQGFCNYPLYEWLIPNENERKRKLASFIRMLVRFGLHHGELRTTPGSYDGVIIYVDSRIDQGPVSPFLWSMCGSSEVEDTWGPETAKRWSVVSKVINAMRAKHAHMPHVYILSLAIKPPKQGTGAGSQLLNSLLADLDKKHVPCYLETFKAVNEKIYQHFGFKTMELFPIPDTNLTLYSMLR